MVVVVPLVERQLFKDCVTCNELNGWTTGVPVLAGARFRGRL